MSEDPDFETVVGLLDDECARTILTATSTKPLSATELVERTDVSQQTVYRRLERLTEAGLVTEATRPRSDGHHDTVYVAILDQFEVRLDDGAFEFELGREKTSGADELTRLWRKF